APPAARSQRVASTERWQWRQRAVRLRMDAPHVGQRRRLDPAATRPIANEKQPIVTPRKMAEKDAGSILRPAPPPSASKSLTEPSVTKNTANTMSRMIMSCSSVARRPRAPRPGPAVDYPGKSLLSLVGRHRRHGPPTGAAPPVWIFILLPEFRGA